MFLRFCAKRTVRSRARLCIDLGANVADIFLLLDRVVRNKRKCRGESLYFPGLTHDRRNLISGNER